MAANQNTTLTLLGVTSLGSSVGKDYFEMIRIGDATPGHAGEGTDELFVEGASEFKGKIWLTGSSMENDAAFFWTAPTNTATAWQVGTDGEAYITCDSTTGKTQVEVAQKLELSVKGWYNEAGGTGSTRQRERFVVALAASDAGGGVLNFGNPWGVECFVDIIVHVTTKSTAACTVDVGVAATGTSDDSIIDGLDVGTAIGTFSNDNEAYNSTPNSDAAVTHVTLGAVQYVTISKATGAAAGTAGYAIIYLEPTT